MSWIWERSRFCKIKQTAIGYYADETVSSADGDGFVSGTGSRPGSSYGIDTINQQAAVNYGFEKDNPKSGDVYTINSEGEIKKTDDQDKDNNGKKDSEESEEDTGSDGKSDEEEDPVTDSGATE